MWPPPYVGICWDCLLGHTGNIDGWMYRYGYTRLFYSPNLLTVELWEGYETWPLIGWHHPFLIGWSEYRVEVSVAMHCGHTSPVSGRNFHHFSGITDVPLAQLQQQALHLRWDCAARPWKSLWVQQGYSPVIWQGTPLISPSNPTHIRKFHRPIDITD